MNKVNLKALSDADLRAFFDELGLPVYRSRQLLHWIYERWAASVEEITEFSKALRERLSKVAYISNLALLDHAVSADGTEKFLFALEDGENIESVLIPDEGRLTLCISSQAGCAMGCGFCRTGKDGLRRDLEAHEIVDQIIQAERAITPNRITNIVMMGMGEPLKNIDSVAEALHRMTGLLKISKRKITVSTSGMVPGIEALARMAPEVNLAISLNATTDEVRDRIMPVNRRHSIQSLMKACRKFPLQKRRRITFEYVLLADVNDTEYDARRLIELLSNIPNKVNLIPFNEFEGCDYRRPSDERIIAFQSILLNAGLTAIIRKSKGSDIMAACGQLRHRHKATQASLS
jgi:23S rRNA (adenine2503-C2)-methyltransferase